VNKTHMYSWFFFYSASVKFHSISILFHASVLGLNPLDQEIHIKQPFWCQLMIYAIAVYRKTIWSFK